MPKHKIEEIIVRAKYIEVIKRGRLLVSTLEKIPYNIGHGIWYRPEKGRSIGTEYLIPQTRKYLACPKMVHSCIGRFYGYSYEGNKNMVSRNISREGQINQSPL